MFLFTDEIRHEEAIPELGVDAGSSLAHIINKMVEKFVDINNAMDKETFSASASGISAKNILYSNEQPLSLGVEAKKLTDSIFSVSLDRGDNVADISYATDAFVVPDGSKIVSTSVNISGQKHNGRTQILNTKSNKLTHSIQYNRFPIIVDARVVVATKTGDVELRKTVVLAGDKTVKQSLQYDIIDRSIQRVDNTLDGVIRDLDDRLKRIELK